MPFPFTFSGSFRIATTADIVETQELLEIAIVEWLEASWAHGIVKQENRIGFKADVSRLVTGWKLPRAINLTGSGEILLSAHRKEIVLAYRFRLIQLFILLTVLIPLLLGSIFFIAPNFSAIQATTILALVWVFLFGGHYLFANIYLPRALRYIARDSTGGYIY
ncbi:MAG: hypothetical protein HKN28_16575 [Alphaproteobacteria bacterium]|nr:hypothetical protein [Alphaproteobacteria bacterium]